MQFSVIPAECPTCNYYTMVIGENHIQDTLNELVEYRFLNRQIIQSIWKSICDLWKTHNAFFKGKLKAGAFLDASFNG